MSVDAQACADRVEAYLAAIGRGDLAEASTFLAPDVVLEFPGGRTYRDLAALAQGSASRYRWIDKHRDRYEATVRGDGTIQVVSLGRLFGENVHGVRFDGVRYVDVFQFRDGLIVEQLVFNDLRETGVLDVTSTDDLAEVHRP